MGKSFKPRERGGEYMSLSSTELRPTHLFYGYEMSGRCLESVSAEFRLCDGGFRRHVSACREYPSSLCGEGRAASAFPDTHSQSHTRNRKKNTHTHLEKFISSVIWAVPSLCVTLAHLLLYIKSCNPVTCIQSLHKPFQ